VKDGVMLRALMGGEVSGRVQNGVVMITLPAQSAVALRAF
jgi:hypothetical protein